MAPAGCRRFVVAAVEPALFDGRLRTLNAYDVLFCWLRQADARLNSDGWWAINDTFVGIKELHQATANPDATLAQQAFDAAVKDGIENYPWCSLADYMKPASKRRQHTPNVTSSALP